MAVPKMYVKNKLPQHAIVKQGKIAGGGFRKHENLKENRSDLVNKNIIEWPSEIDPSILNYFRTVKSIDEQNKINETKVDLNSDLKQVDRYIGKGLDTEEEFYSSNDIFLNENFQGSMIKRDDVIFNLEKYEGNDQYESHFPLYQYPYQENVINVGYMKKPNVKILTSSILSISKKY